MSLNVSLGDISVPIMRSIGPSFAVGGVISGFTSVCSSDIKSPHAFYRIGESYCLFDQQLPACLLKKLFFKL